MEKQFLLDALEQQNWDEKAAAATLNIEFEQFQKLYQKHNLSDDEK